MGTKVTTTVAGLCVTFLFSSGCYGEVALKAISTKIGEVAEPGPAVPLTWRTFVEGGGELPVRIDFAQPQLVGYFQDGAPYVVSQAPVVIADITPHVASEPILIGSTTETRVTNGAMIIPSSGCSVAGDKIADGTTSHHFYNRAGVLGNSYRDSLNVAPSKPLASGGFRGPLSVAPGERVIATRSIPFNLGAAVNDYVGVHQSAYVLEVRADTPLEPEFRAGVCSPVLGRIPARRLNLSRMPVLPHGHGLTPYALQDVFDHVQPTGMGIPTLANGPSWTGTYEFPSGRANFPLEFGNPRVTRYGAVFQAALNYLAIHLVLPERTELERERIATYLVQMALDRYSYLPLFLDSSGHTTMYAFDGGQWQGILSLIILAGHLIDNDSLRDAYLNFGGFSGEGAQFYYSTQSWHPSPPQLVFRKQSGSPNNNPLSAFFEKPLNSAQDFVNSGSGSQAENYLECCTIATTGVYAAIIKGLGLQAKHNPALYTTLGIRDPDLMSASYDRYNWAGFGIAHQTRFVRHVLSYLGNRW